MSRSSLSLGDLVEHWTLVGAERDLVVVKHPDTQLGFGLLLKFYGRFGRFPRGRSELHQDAVDFMAKQLGVEAGSLGFYEWTGRTIKRHRAEIRTHMGFRECTVADAQMLTEWLAEGCTQRERRYELVRDELLAQCRILSIEPPTPDRVERIVRSGLHRGEKLLTERICTRLSAEVTARLLGLIAVLDDGEPDLLALIKEECGNVSLASMLKEISRLEAVRSIGLPEGLFADVTPRVLAGWKAQAMVESPSHLRDHPPALQVTLLAALVYCRSWEITDALVTLLIRTVHTIGARAERRVTTKLVAEFKRVQGKESMLFRVADASAARPDGTVRAVVFPVIGEDNLRNLIAEYKASGSTYRRTVATTYKASYSNHYRRGLIQLLEVLDFRCENTHRPVLDALDLVYRHRASVKFKYYPVEETIPTHRGLGGDWADLVYHDDQQGRRRVMRTVYEIRTFDALCDQLKCKGVWVVGAREFRNPDEDLPKDFDARRVEHYQALRKPLDSSQFISGLQEEMRTELSALADALPLDWLRFGRRPGNQGAIKLTPLEALAEPVNLGRLKKTILGRWGTVPLIDALKEAVLRSKCPATIASMFGRGEGPDPRLLEKLLLVIYAYGTNTGIRAVAAGDHGYSEDELYYIRRRYLSPDLVRALAIDIANATFAARQASLWGAGSTAVTSDSTHFGAFDQNIFTEWHSRYGGRGVLIYWHIETGSVVIHSQLIGCTASEVAAMIDGAMHHGTVMDVEANYVDTHGQSLIGFGLTRLLGFDLLARIKAINRVRLYRPGPGDSYPGLAAAMVSRPIRWDLIGEQYDQMIKYATAIRTRSAETAAILRRFAATNVMHPTYQAMLEVGRAQRTIFVSRYLRERDLQREIHAGRNVSESWHAGNSIIHFGKGGDITSNRRDEQELAVLCLRTLQASVVYLNTLMVQDVLDEELLILGNEDKRGLTPLFWSNIAPYGEIRLNMNNRIALNYGTGLPPTTPTGEEQPR